MQFVHRSYAIIAMVKGVQKAHIWGAGNHAYRGYDMTFAQKLEKAKQNQRVRLLKWVAPRDLTPEQARFLQLQNEV